MLLEAFNEFVEEGVPTILNLVVELKSLSLLPAKLPKLDSDLKLVVLIVSFFRMDPLLLKLLRLLIELIILGFLVLV